MEEQERLLYMVAILESLPPQERRRAHSSVVEQ